MHASDLFVVGAGPAGLALAAAAAEAGLRVQVVDPAPERPWPANYGLWTDEAAALGLPLARQWARPFVHTDRAEIGLPRAYGQLDGGALRSALHERLAAAGGSVREGRVEGVAHDERGSTVQLEGGTSMEAGIVADCSGHRPALVQRPRAEATAFQTAWGELIRVDRHPWTDGAMAWMDFRTGPVGGPDGPPTFLYAMPVTDELVFVEETALAARPPVPRALLEARLHQRLAAMGLRVRERLDTEWCVIPMDAAVPPAQRVVALGGAASMVHPATGYSVVSALSAVPAMVAVLVGAGAPADRARAAWDVLWPAERRALWSVLDFGREALLSLDVAGTHRFFEAFFAMDVDRWGPFLAGRLGPRDAGATMFEMFRHAPADLRLRLSAAGLRPSGLSAVGAMLATSGGSPPRW